MCISERRIDGTNTGQLMQLLGVRVPLFGDRVCARWHLSTQDTGLGFQFDDQISGHFWWPLKIYFLVCCTSWQRCFHCGNLFYNGFWSRNCQESNSRTYLRKFTYLDFLLVTFPKIFKLIAPVLKLFFLWHETTGAIFNCKPPKDNQQLSVRFNQQSIHV